MEERNAGSGAEERGVRVGGVVDAVLAVDAIFVVWCFGFAI